MAKRKQSVSDSERCDIEAALQGEVEWWQALLRLRDWDVTVELVGRNDMSDANHLGECHADPLERSATVLVVRPEELPEELRSVKGLETVVVHELCHLWMRDAEQCSDAEEYVVRRVSKALCALKQGVRP